MRSVLQFPKPYTPNRDSCEGACFGVCRFWFWDDLGLQGPVG